MLTKKECFKAVGRAWLMAFFIATSRSADAACLDIGNDKPLSLSGKLSFQIFGGAPYNGGVQQGDTPEPTYILRPDTSFCVIGDEFLDEGQVIDRVQVYPDQGYVSLPQNLRRLVGRRVTVNGRSAFGAHTGHHHAPLMLPISGVAPLTVAPDTDQTAMTTVQAFYLALAAGSGEEATRFVVAEKRTQGPFSAAAITGFYKRLKEPLELIEVIAIHPDEYRVRYKYVASSSKRCDGTSVVRTVKRDQNNYVLSVKAINGC
jgi:hypothetical protein